MNPIIERYTSRKFLLAVTGVITGIVAIVQGETVAGCSLMATAIIGYLIAEGYIDAQSATSIIEVVGDIAEVAGGEADDEE